MALKTKNLFKGYGLKFGKATKLRTCRRCLKQYIGTHVCELALVETEAERVKKEGKF